MKLLRKIAILSSIALQIFSAATADAQELNARVNINYSSLSNTPTPVFQALQKDVTAFLNEHRWTNHTYDVNEKLAFNTTFLYMGERYNKVWNNGPYWMTKYPPQYDVVKLKDVYDLSLGADYRFNDQLSVFAKLDNVLNQKYQLFYDYPVTGIQFFAGLKMRF